ncbi:MAG TPA: hypothetical protein IAC34_01690 [Candidatus Coprenecus stercoripullorum]|nr:hypothetical protein [Candidatus Coprenecus stercoripullorum]
MPHVSCSIKVVRDLEVTGRLQGGRRKFLLAAACLAGTFLASCCVSRKPQFQWSHYSAGPDSCVIVNAAYTGDFGGVDVEDVYPETYVRAYRGPSDYSTWSFKSSWFIVRTTMGVDGWQFYHIYLSPNHSGEERGFTVSTGSDFFNSFTVSQSSY